MRHLLLVLLAAVSLALVPGDVLAKKPKPIYDTSGLLPATVGQVWDWSNGTRTEMTVGTNSFLPTDYLDDDTRLGGPVLRRAEGGDLLLLGRVVDDPSGKWPSIASVYDDPAVFLPALMTLKKKHVVKTTAKLYDHLSFATPIGELKKVKILVRHKGKMELDTILGNVTVDVIDLKIIERGKLEGRKYKAKVKETWWLREGFGYVQRGTKKKPVTLDSEGD